MSGTGVDPFVGFLAHHRAINNHSSGSSGVTREGRRNGGSPPSLAETLSEMLTEVTWRGGFKIEAREVRITRETAGSPSSQGVGGIFRKCDDGEVEDFMYTL